MLKIREINRLREMYYEQNLSITKISELMNVSRSTVYRYIHIEDFNPKPRRRANAKIKPYVTIINSWLKDDRSAPRKQRHTYRRIFTRLQDLYPKFALSFSTISRYVKRAKQHYKSLYSYYLPLSHDAREAQADLFELEYIDCNNNRAKAQAVTLSFPHSNMAYCQVFRGKAVECFLRGLKNIFEHINGTPRTIWFDNDTSIVQIRLNREKNRSFNEHFLRFKNHYKFKSHFCNIRCANEKGNVESNIKALRNNLFVPAPQIDDFDEYNKDLLLRCEKLKNTPHYINGENILELFNKDKNTFNNLPNIDFDVTTNTTRKVNKTGKITIDKCRHYYVNPKYVRQKVRVQQTHNEVIVYDYWDDTEITRFTRFFGDDITVQTNWEAYLPIIAVKPKCVNNIEFADLYLSEFKKLLLNMSAPALKIFLMSLATSVSETKDLELALKTQTDTL